MKKEEAITQHNLSPQRTTMEKFTEAVMEFVTTASKIPLPEPRRALFQDRVSHFVSLLHNPDHPPYAWMIERALQELNQKRGSSEESISKFIKGEYSDLPWSHSTMLKYHLARLCQSGEVVSTPGHRYLLPAAISERKVRKTSRKVKRKRGWDREIMRSKRRKKANKGNNNSITDNKVGLLLSQQKDHATSKVLSQEVECTIEGNKQQEVKKNDVALLCSLQKDQSISKELNKHGACSIGGNNLLKGDKVGLLLFEENSHGTSKDNNERDCTTEETKQQKAKANVRTDTLKLSIVEDSVANGDTDIPLNVAPSLVTTNQGNNFSKFRMEQPRCETIAGIIDCACSEVQMDLGSEQPEDNDPELATPERPPGFEFLTFEQSSQLQPHAAYSTELRPPSSVSLTLEQSSQFQSQTAASTESQAQQFNQNSVFDFGDAQGESSEPEVLIFKESTPKYCGKRYSRRMKRQPVGKTLSFPSAEFQDRDRYPPEDKTHSDGQTSPEQHRGEKVAQGNRICRVLRSQTARQNQSKKQEPECPIHQGMLHEVKRDTEVVTELTLPTHQTKVGLVLKGPKSNPFNGAVRNKLLFKDDLRKKKSGLKARGRPPKACMPSKAVPDRMLMADIALSNDQDQQHHEHPLHPSLENLDVAIAEMLPSKPANNSQLEQQLAKPGHEKPLKPEGPFFTTVKSI